jgi:hypothetical protein
VHTLVLAGWHGSGLLAGFSCRILDRLLARAFGSRLDRQLAGGRSPDSARLLAARAQYLVSLAARQALAESWEHLLRVARSTPASPRPLMPPCGDRVVAAAAEVNELAAQLRAPLPVAARGAAAASALLTDGSGPVYNRRHPASLREALRLVTAQLDPSLPLVASP